MVEEIKLDLEDLFGIPVGGHGSTGWTACGGKSCSHLLNPDRDLSGLVVGGFSGNHIITTDGRPKNCYFGGMAGNDFYQDGLPTGYCLGGKSGCEIIRI